MVSFAEHMTGISPVSFDDDENDVIVNMGDGNGSSNESYLNYLLHDIDVMEVVGDGDDEKEEEEEREEVGSMTSSASEVEDNKINSLQRMESAATIIADDDVHEGAAGFDLFGSELDSLCVSTEGGEAGIEGLIPNLGTGNELFQMMDINDFSSDLKRTSSSSTATNVGEYLVKEETLNKSVSELYSIFEENNQRQSVPQSEAVTPVSSPSPVTSPDIDIDAISLQEVDEIYRGFGDFVEPSKFFPSLFDSESSTEDEDDEEDHQKHDIEVVIEDEEENITVEEEAVTPPEPARPAASRVKEEPPKKGSNIPKDAIIPSREDIRAIISAMSVPEIENDSEEEDIDVVTVSEPSSEELRGSSTSHKRKYTSSKEPSVHKSKKAKQSDSHKSSRSALLLSVGENTNLASPEAKRTIHNVLERKRRNDLKYSFQNLRNCIPDIETNDKAPKVLILKKATDFICFLQRQEKELAAEKERLKASNKASNEKIKSLKTATSV
eukprot:Nk52_evm1s1535 gene=Nk52_evmTU1s1535